MSRDATDPLEILERCIVENSSDAWAALLAEYASVVRRVYHAHADAAGFPDFEAWFPGWLYYERKLHAAYRSLQAKIRSEDCPTAPSQRHYLANYLAAIVRSAVAEFCHEHKAVTTRQVPDAVLSAVPAAVAPADSDLEGRIRAILLRLTPDLRIPFWLRYLQVFGPLPTGDAGPSV